MTKIKEQDQEAEDSPYEMSLSLNVLNHLGLNLYSNVPAVLSEAVANAWDADAEEVEVTINPDEELIGIKDNGHGMSREDVNQRYLHVGYQRRDDPDRGTRTKKHNRPVMGRKGIGKLSLFSIARTVEVYTAKDGEENAFRMDVSEIKEAIGEEDPNSEEDPRGSYKPTPLDEFPFDFNQGTVIILKDLKKSVHTAENALRKRLARRFSVISPDYNFKVSVNDERVTVTDRDYFHKIQFLWTFGDDDDTYEGYCANLEHSEERPDETASEYEVEGWIGTAELPKDLVESYPGEQNETDDLNKISLMVRGKMAQADLMDDFNDGRMYTKYLVGEIHADFLDLDDEPDAATSARERIVKDDPRYIELQEFLEDELNHIANKWSDLRREKGSEQARQDEKIDDWFESLSEQNRAKAEKLFGKINQITTDSDEDKKALFKYGVMAFERLRYKENLDKLDQISPADLSAAGDVFLELEDLEAILYHQIVSQRLEVIDKMQEKVEENALEDVLQEHLFENLWLLDPSWERATKTKYMEQTVQKEFDEVTDRLTDDQRRGRVDIKYRKTTGQHVIIELKRAERRVSRYELEEQVDKYRKALRKILRDQGHENQTIQVVCVVGEDLTNWENDEDQEEDLESLRRKNIRVMKYQELLQNAHKAYNEYIQEQDKASETAALIKSIETGELFD